MPVPVVSVVHRCRRRALHDEVADMDLQKLQTEYPELYKACVDIGIEQERDRSCGHIQLGEQCSAMKLAYAAILNGEDVTPTHYAHYLAAGRAHIELALRLEDDVEVEAALENARMPKSAYADPFEKQVTDRLAELLDTSSADARIEDLGA